MEKSKIEIIREKIEREGKISRNWCLAMYYTRLAARITDLRNEGWEIEGKEVFNDYVYVVTKRPKARQLSLV